MSVVIDGMWGCVGVRIAIMLWCRVCVSITKYSSNYNAQFIYGIVNYVNNGEYLSIIHKL